MAAEHRLGHAFGSKKIWLRTLLNQHLLSVFDREINFVLREVERRSRRLEARESPRQTMPAPKPRRT